MSDSPIEWTAFRSKIIWSEGMYLRPQHFQQLERYMESYIQQRCPGLHGAHWGFHSLELDPEAFASGCVCLCSAHGILPDGTPFQFNSRSEAPPALRIAEDMKNEVVTLALPVRRPGSVDVVFDEQEDALARFKVCTYELADANAVALGPAAVQIGIPRLRLVPASALGGEWQGIGVLRVTERRHDGCVVCDPGYVPPLLAIGRQGGLAAFVSELHGLLEQRAAALAQRLAQSGRGGTGEVMDFLLLGLINRAQASTWLWQHSSGAHPQTVFREWLQLASDLSTYTSQDRRPAVWPVYRHDDLQSSFGPLIAELRRSLSTVLEQNAVAIALQERAQRLWVAQIPNVDLIRNAGFVLAIHADLPDEIVRARYPAQIKIGPVEQLSDLVHSHLPGIGIRGLPVPPRQLPYHAGCHYFEIDTGCELWAQLEKSGGLGLHVSGDLPGLTMECWAIRG